MKKEEKIHLINLFDKLKRTDNMRRLHGSNDSDAMFKQYQAISNDTIFEILAILYSKNDINHELVNKISFNLFIKYPTQSTNKIINDDEFLPNLELMLG